MNLETILTGSAVVAFSIAAFWLLGIVVKHFCERAVTIALSRLHRDLGTLKWAGADEGWEFAIKAVRADIVKRLASITNATNKENGE